MTTLFINFLAFGTLLSSIFSITSKNPVISVIFLISSFVQAAGYLILIGVNYVGISYIVVYVGAIAVLFLFIIMLLNIRLSEITEVSTLYTKNLPLAIAVGSLFVYEFFSILPLSFNEVSILSFLLNLISNLNGFLFNSNLSTNKIGYLTINLITPDTAIADFSQVQALGLTLYTIGAVWLIIMGLILLLAMFAPITLNKKSKNKNIINLTPPGPPLTVTPPPPVKFACANFT